MPDVFPARYAGYCSECHQGFDAGDDITATSIRGQYAHVECPVDLTILDKRPDEVTCTRCWLIHPVGACDLD